MIWNENNNEKLQNVMLSEEDTNKLDSLFFPYKTTNSSVDINERVTSKNVLLTKNNKENTQVKTQSQGKRWYNESCYASKRNVRF